MPDRLRKLAKELREFDCTTGNVPRCVDVPDDYETGMNDAGALLHLLLEQEHVHLCPAPAEHHDLNCDFETGECTCLI